MTDESQSRKPIGLILVIFASLVFIIGTIILSVMAVTQRADQEEANTKPSNGQVTFEGQYTCLPVPDDGRPHDLLCALGVKTDKGAYYGLSFADVDQSGLSDLSTGDRVSVTGTLKEPREGYVNEGVILVTSFEEE